MYRPSVGEWALGAVLLHVHAKEANVHTVNLLKGKKCFGSVGKGLRHFTRVHKSVEIKKINYHLTVVHIQQAVTFTFMSTESHIIYIAI